MNLVDRLICEIDTGLRTVFAKAHASRSLPKVTAPLSVGHDSAGGETNAETIRLMRVNHCGEVCAQALYHGQAFVAKDATIHALLMEAAAEEHDHLAWCDSRLAELGGHTSLLNPVFYAASFGLGVFSGMLGDKWSLGFLVETERQVEAHLQDHLGRVSETDAETRAILEAMREDEIRHGQSGLDHGAKTLPLPLRGAMHGFSKVMTTTTYWV
ncbi:MAG: 2-polyprenyl-3-methyl-6-methoxy-1,4-benzoquinone monooxygenase [Betaproteobacteria bacterium]